MQGKTTLALQFLLEGIRLGEKCLYVALSENKEELSDGAKSHDWSLDGIDVLELAATEKDLLVDTQVTMYSPSEVELSETNKSVIEAFARIQPARVVFDSLSELRLLSQSSLRYRRQILALKQYLTGKDSTVLLLDDGTSEGPDLQLQSIAHGVIKLEQLAPDYGAERRRARIIKFRGSAYRGGSHDFKITKGGLVVFPRLVSAEHRLAFKIGPIQSGVEGLDSLLGGGPHRERARFSWAPPEAENPRSRCSMPWPRPRGDHAVVFAFDESVATLEARTAGLGIAFKAGTEKGAVRLEQIDPAEVSPGEFVHRVQAHSSRKGRRKGHHHRQFEWLYECHA